MRPEEIGCVVGIDVAKASPVVCALEAPRGAVRLTSASIAASTAGDAQRGQWLREWGEPPTLRIGRESTGSWWEPLYDTLTQAGYRVLLRTPHQTASWARSRGLRAKTAGIDARTLARGRLAGWARASTVPDETVQALRALTRARRDLVEPQRAARQRLPDEVVPVFPELASHLPEHADLGAPAVLRWLSVSSSAQAVARAHRDEIRRVLQDVSAGRWGRPQAQALQTLAEHAAASTRAVAARSVVVRTLALPRLDRHTRLAERETAVADLLTDDAPSQQLQGRCGQVPGLGPPWTATIRAELGDVSRFTHVDQVMASAGLAPRTHESGRDAGQKRLSKQGPGALRQALYLATLVAVRFRPEWQLRYQRLLDRGRAKKEALTILSRQLLKVIYHLLRTGASYDPAYLNPVPPAGRG